MDPAQTLMQCVLQFGSGTDLVLICGAHAAFISATTVSLNGLFSSEKKCLIFKCFQVGETYFCLCSLEISHRNFLAGIGRFNR